MKTSNGRIRLSRGRYERILSDNVRYRTNSIAVGLTARNIVAAQSLNGKVSGKAVVTRAFNFYLQNPRSFRMWCAERTTAELDRDCEYPVPIAQKAVLEGLIKHFGTDLDQVEIILSLIIEFYGNSRT